MSFNAESTESRGNLHTEQPTSNNHLNVGDDNFRLNKLVALTPPMSTNLQVAFGSLQIVHSDGADHKKVQVAEVDATLDRTTGTLTVTDKDTNESIAVHAISGNGKYGIGYEGGQGADGKFDDLRDRGPIPQGDYLIGEGHIHLRTAILYPGGDTQWYKLLGSDGKGGYSYNKFDDGKGGTRGGINLHTGSISDGCLTIPSDLGILEDRYPQSADYDKVKTLLDKTKPIKYEGNDYLGFLHVK